MNPSLSQSTLTEPRHITPSRKPLQWIPLCIAVFSLHLGLANAEESKAGFVSIFDGKTLEGWSASFPEASEAWYVKDGYIVGEGSKGRCYLVYDGNHDIADFELKFTYRFPDDGNSGVNIRAKKDPTGKRDYQAYHVDIGQVGIGKNVLGAWDFHTPGRTEHRCFRGDDLIIQKDDKPIITPLKGAVQLKDINKQGWNKVHVVVRGNTFKFSINGKPASQFKEHLPENLRLKSGMIQFQLHDPGMFVHFKDIQLKVLE